MNLNSENGNIVGDILLQGNGYLVKYRECERECEREYERECEDRESGTYFLIPVESRIKTF